MPSKGNQKFGVENADVHYGESRAVPSRVLITSGTLVAIPISAQSYTTTSRRRASDLSSSRNPDPGKSCPATETTVIQYLSLGLIAISPPWTSIKYKPKGAGSPRGLMHPLNGDDRGDGYARLVDVGTHHLNTKDLAGVKSNLNGTFQANVSHPPMSSRGAKTCTQSEYRGRCRSSPPTASLPNLCRRMHVLARRGQLCVTGFKFQLKCAGMLRFGISHFRHHRSPAPTMWRRSPDAGQAHSFWERLTSWLGSFATPDSTTVTRRWRLYFRRMGKGKFCKQASRWSGSRCEERAHKGNARSAARWDCLVTS
ncbi:hypothetical protein BJ322DRAFT_1025656 [Thelephora terrestris]|uniref:Uncharacterized protein n=1 Tax=Thelephora terrestris TaxID=56493 RepID=A0A9P6L0Q2_9AGAM|nr:hypothetical protein BJ322DRAFT_1025656 [Thelephora terrestris]